MEELNTDVSFSSAIFDLEKSFVFGRKEALCDALWLAVCFGLNVTPSPHKLFSVPGFFLSTFIFYMILLYLLDEHYILRYFKVKQD